MKHFFKFLALFSFALNTISAQAPANYYNGTAGLSGATLKTKLSQIISAGYHQGSYADLWTAYNTTDRDYFYENDGSILDIYSENPTGTDPYNYTYQVNQCGGSTPSGEGGCYNREHIVPQSLFSSNLPMYSDIHFIRPTDNKVNGMRGNLPFGKVGILSSVSGNPSLNGSKVGASVSSGYTGQVFEPINNFKGDVARMVFYFATRYENNLSSFSTGNILGNTTYPGLQNWELLQLLAWNMQDPPSAEEISRNNKTYIIQNNRNPYIDNYLWANEVWGSMDTVSPTPPTSLTSTGATTNTISLSWNAATDNVAVISYDVYVGGVYKMSVSGTTATVSGLIPATTYTFYVIAKDVGNNSSQQSNTVSETTLSNLGTSELTDVKNDFQIVPNPVKNQELYVKGQRLSEVKTAQIFSMDGRLIQEINRPFVDSDRILLEKFSKGVYLLKLDKITLRFIVEK